MRILTIDEKINMRENTLSSLESDRVYIAERLKARLNNKLDEQDTKFILDCFYYRPIML